jgi:hypothetical protein
VLSLHACTATTAVTNNNNRVKVLPDSADETALADPTCAFIKITSVKPRVEVFDDGEGARVFSFSTPFTSSGKVSLRLSLLSTCCTYDVPLIVELLLVVVAMFKQHAGVSSLLLSALLPAYETNQCYSHCLLFAAITLSLLLYATLASITC